MSIRFTPRRSIAAFAALCVFLTCAPIARPADAPTTGPSDVSTVEYTWHDSARERDVPVKIYYPKISTGAVPVIIFSHGLGGSREGYHYLGEYWAAHGFVSVHLQHIGSDDSVWKQQGIGTAFAALKKAANYTNAVARCRDVSFAIDELVKLNADESSPLKGRLDLTKIGMSGHSFGGGTTMAIAGQEAVVAGQEITYADPRIKAAIAMSPPSPQNQNNDDTAFAKIKVPLFILTGTDDNSPIGETKAADRRVGFDHLDHAPAYLLTFNGGDHMLFSGQRRGPSHSTDPLYHELILQGTTAFWNAYLSNDQQALKWFSGGGYMKQIGESGVFEFKGVAMGNKD